MHHMLHHNTLHALLQRQYALSAVMRMSMIERVSVSLVFPPHSYRGQVATDHEHAGHLMNGLDWVRAH